MIWAAYIVSLIGYIIFAAKYGGDPPGYTYILVFCLPMIFGQAAAVTEAYLKSDHSSMFFQMCFATVILLGGVNRFLTLSNEHRAFVTLVTLFCVVFTVGYLSAILHRSDGSRVEPVQEYDKNEMRRAQYILFPMQMLGVLALVWQAKVGGKFDVEEQRLAFFFLQGTQILGLFETNRLKKVHGMMWVQVFFFGAAFIGIGSNLRANMDIPSVVATGFWACALVLLWLGAYDARSEEGAKHAGSGIQASMGTATLIAAGLILATF